jgi:hypothetical protein
MMLLLGCYASGNYDNYGLILYLGSQNGTQFGIPHRDVQIKVYISE